MSERIKKLCLGTAQFGSDYGIANKGGKMAREEAMRVLAFARECGIVQLDTAYAYGDSQTVIGQFIAQTAAEFELISKVNIDERTTEEMVEATLTQLRSKRLYGLLVHSYGDFKSHPAIFREMCELKERGIIQKAGFSLYSPDELDDLHHKKVRFDIVQVPFSLFDRRFESRFEELKEHGVEIHVRSVFLQGLAFLDPGELEGHLCKAAPQLHQLRRFCDRSGLSESALCLNFALDHSMIDRVVIGVDGLSQLQTDIANIGNAAKVTDFNQELQSLIIDDEEILMPYKWETV